MYHCASERIPLVLRPLVSVEMSPPLRSLLSVNMYLSVDDPSPSSGGFAVASVLYLGELPTFVRENPTKLRRPGRCFLMR